MAMFEIKNCKNVELKNNTSNGKRVDEDDVVIEGEGSVVIDGKKLGKERDGDQKWWRRKK